MNCISSSASPFVSDAAKSLIFKDLAGELEKKGQNHGIVALALRP